MIDRLIALGMSPGEAERKAARFAETDRAVASHPQPMRWFVPGRIEVLGKHTDYAGGRSLVCAAERGFCVTAVPRSDARLRIVDVVNRTEATLRVHVDQPDETRWRAYPATVARRVARNFPTAAGLRGAEIAFASDLPRAAGLSSSTALIIAVFGVLAEINELEAHDAYRANIPTIEALASYLGCVENGRTFGTLAGDSGVGTLGGSQDHTAILRSEAGRLVRCAYSPPRVEQVVALPPDVTFLIGSSGIAAEKTGAAREQYNRGARMVAAILARWHAATGRHDDRTLFDVVTGRLRPGSAGWSDAGRELCDVLMAALPADLDGFTSDALLARVNQFAIEALGIVPRAADALAAGDLDAFGTLVDGSQAAAERWLDNQIPETIALARLARRRGALAASAFGAGFGGSVWALVPTHDASAILAGWSHDYLDRFPSHAERAAFFVTRAGPPRVRL